MSVEDGVLSNDGSSLAFSVALSEPAQADVVVPYQYNTPDGVVEGAVVIAEGTTEATIVVPTVDQRPGTSVHVVLSEVNSNWQVEDGDGQGEVPDDSPPTDIAIGEFYADGLNLLVDYTVYGRPSGPFKIAIFASPDGTTIPSQWLEVGEGNTALGEHTLIITPTFSDLSTDYYLIAKVDSLDTVDESDEGNNISHFDGGTFVVHEAASHRTIVHVEGTEWADWVTLAGGDGSLSVSIERKLSASDSGGDLAAYPDFTGDNRVGQVDADAVLFNQVHSARLWENPVNRFDVDGDGEVTVGDALVLYQELRSAGTRLLAQPPDPAAAPRYDDVNGDNVLSIVDLRQLIGELDPVGGNGGQNAPWRNSADPFDVNNDGYVSPIDALILVNVLSSTESVDLSTPPDASAPHFYYDVSGDNQLSHLDVVEMMVVFDASGSPLAQELFADTPWRNPANALDVNDDGDVDASDSGDVLASWPRGYAPIRQFALVGIDQVHIRTHGGNDTVATTLGDAATGLWIFGGPGDDQLSGASGNDFIKGGLGDDTLYGEAGNDKLVGAAGNDKLFGGDGDDTLLGGDNKDLLMGQDGEDKLDSDDSDALTARIHDWSGTEHDEHATFVITLSRASNQDITIPYETQVLSGTAAAIPEHDFTPSSGTLTIPAHQTSATISIPVIDDSTEDADKRFEVRLVSQSSAKVILDRWAAIGTIQDADGPDVAISAVSADEGQAISFTISLSRAGIYPATVTYSLDAAAPGAHFSDFPAAGPLTIAFAPGETSKTITLHSIDDHRNGPDQTVAAHLLNASHANIIQADVAGTLHDIDPLPMLNISDWNGWEGTGTTSSKAATFTATLSAPSLYTIQVPYATADGTAIADTTSQTADYIAASDTLTFSPGETVKHIHVTIHGDAADEDDETFQVNLGAAEHTIVGQLSGLGTILDDDGPGVTVSDASANEGNDLVFTISLSAASVRPITVQYGTLDGTAKAGGEYTTPALSSAAFAPGETTKNVTVSTQLDGLNDDPERMFLTLLSASHGRISRATGTGTIIDGDPEPTLSVADVTAATGSTQVTVTVQLSAPSAKDVSVLYDTAADSAAIQSAPDGIDYQAKHGGLVISAGQTTASISIDIIHDHAIPSEETFAVQLSQPGGATLADSQAIVTIPPYTPPSWISITSARGTVAGGQMGGFSLTRTGDTSQAVTVHYHISEQDSTAEAGADYAPLPGTTTETPRLGAVTFAAGDSSAEILVAALTNSASQTAKTLCIALVDDMAYDLGNVSSATIAIRQAVTANLPRVSLSRSENNIQQIILPQASGGTWTIGYDGNTTAPLGADSAATDVQAALSSLIGDGNVSVTQPTASKATFNVEFTGAMAGQSVATLTVDPSALSDVVATTGTVTDSGAQSGPHVVSLDHAVGGSFTLTFDDQTTDPIAFDADAPTVQQSLWKLSSVGAGNMVVSGTSGGPWTVTFLGALAFSDRSLSIDTTQLENSVVRTVQSGGPLPDTMSDAIEGHRNGYVRVFRDGPANQSLTVRYVVLSDPAAGDDAKPDVDYQRLSGTVTIPAGAVSADVVIRPIENQTVAGTRKIRFALLDPLAQAATQPSYVLGTPTAATVSIADEDFAGSRPTISITETADGREAGGVAGTGLGSPGTFRVTLSEPSSTPVVVCYSIDPDSAATTDDFLPLSGSVTIPANQTTADIVVTPIDHRRPQGSESLKLLVTGADQIRYVVGAQESATINIVNDDPLPGANLPVVTIQKPADGDDAKEPGDSGSGIAGQDGTFTLTRSGSLASALTVAYTINNYAAAYLAAPGTDFNYTVDSGNTVQSATGGTVTFQPGDDMVVIHIHPQFNAQTNFDQNVYLSLVASTSDAYVLGSRPTAHIEIVDSGQEVNSDTESVGVVITDYTKDEIQHVQLAGSPTGGTFTLTVNGQPTGPIDYDASADALKEALEQVVGSGNIAVTPGDPLGWSVEFKGALAGKDLLQMTGDGSLLTGAAKTTPSTIVDGALTVNTVYQLTTKPSTTSPSGYSFHITGNYGNSGNIATNWIPYGVSAANLKSFIDPIYGANNSIVSRFGDEASGYRYQITFIGTLATRYDMGFFPGTTSSGSTTTLDERLKAPNETLFTEANGSSSIVPSILSVQTIAPGTSTGVNERQRIVISGNPTGGTFTLTFQDQTTEALAYNASPAAVQAALANLSNLDSDNVSVTGFSGIVYTITFQGSLAKQNVPQIGVDGSELAGVRVTIDQTQAPSSTNEIQEITIPLKDGVPVNSAFRLSFEGETTEPIDATASAATVQQQLQTQLQALTTIGQGNTFVTTNGPFDWSVQFAGALSGKDVPLITSAPSSSLGSSISVSTLADGAFGVSSAKQDIIVRPSADYGRYYFRLYQPSTSATAISDWIPSDATEKRFADAISRRFLGDVAYVLSREDYSGGGYVYHIMWQTSQAQTNLAAYKPPQSSGAFHDDQNRYFDSTSLVTQTLISRGASGPANETQLIAIQGSPTDGTFTISTPSPNTSAPLAYNASPSDVEAALRAVPGIPGDVTVRGGVGSYTVTFGGTVAGFNFNQLQADGSGLSYVKVQTKVPLPSERNLKESISLQGPPTGGTF
jgi:hypothetical protein